MLRLSGHSLPAQDDDAQHQNAQGGGNRTNHQGCTHSVTPFPAPAVVTTSLLKLVLNAYADFFWPLLRMMMTPTTTTASARATIRTTMPDAIAISFPAPA